MTLRASLPTSTLGAAIGMPAVARDTAFTIGSGAPATFQSVDDGIDASDIETSGCSSSLLGIKPVQRSDGETTPSPTTRI
jgi:hypothetical protein